MTTLANMDGITFILTIITAFLICYLFYTIFRIIDTAVNESNTEKEKEKKDEELVTCDKCGHDFKRKYTQHIAYNSSYPIMTNTVWREIDICVNCYADAYIPFLKTLRGRIIEHEEK